MTNDRPTAPFKRGAKLTVTDPNINGGKPTDAEYVRWGGIMRSSLVTVRFKCPNERTHEVTTHVDFCKVRQ